jgi:hypothetical protein
MTQDLLRIESIPFPEIDKSISFITVDISPYLLAISVTNAPVGGVLFFGLKIFPTLLHYRLVLPFS